VLFSEPKIPQLVSAAAPRRRTLQRFSALQRAEIAEIDDLETPVRVSKCFSALQRAEIAEISRVAAPPTRLGAVSVLFNEPKLLKWSASVPLRAGAVRFSALQRAEIAEMQRRTRFRDRLRRFQCSSTSRNC